MKTFIVNANPKPKSGVAFADNEIHLPSPVRVVALLSSPSADSHLYVHFSPLSKVASASPLTTTGSDPWIPMQGASRNFPVIRFDKPVSIFYISGDGGASAATPDFMLLCSDDVDIELGFGAGASITNPLPISGSVSVTNFPATQPISGTVAVSGVVEAVEQGAANGATGQVTLVANTAGVVVASRSTRRAVIVTMLSSVADTFIGIGASAPTLLNGDYLPGVAGANIVIPTNQEVQAISAGTPKLSYLEIYD